MRSSIGFHTFTVFMKTTLKEAGAIYDDFERFRKKTREIKIRPIDKTKIKHGADEFIKRLYSGLTKVHRMEYTCKDKGLSWGMRRSISSPAYIKANLVGEDKSCTIRATLNPKVLNGEKDYLTAANSDCLANTEKVFNYEAAKISPLLQKWGSYACNRIDYCFNGDAKELGLGCTAEQLMKLIKHGNIPDSFSEEIKYDENSHRKKAYKYSFYLKSNSVVINCYWKGEQLKQWCSDKRCLDAARSLIRFEVQCKYSKVYAMSAAIKKENNDPTSILINDLLSPKVCEDVIIKYFSKIVRKGHYFTLDGARSIVEAYNFRRDKEDRLIYALELINECRGISKAETRLLSVDLKDFKRSLNDLDDILVNPVTIPLDWGIDYIPNLLRAYYDTIYEEQLMPLKEFEVEKCIEEYLMEKSICNKFVN